MMAVPPPFSTCRHSTPLASGFLLRTASLHALLAVSCNECTYGVYTRFDQYSSPQQRPNPLQHAPHRDAYSSIFAIIMQHICWLRTIAGLRRRVRRMGTSRSSLIMLCQSSGLPAAHGVMVSCCLMRGVAAHNTKPERAGVNMTAYFSTGEQADRTRQGLLRTVSRALTHP